MQEYYTDFGYDGHREEKPFSSVEEAVLWGLKCQIARNDGARISAGAGRIPRPCDPDDIWRYLQMLSRKRILNNHHMRILSHHGFSLALGAGRKASPPRVLHLWAQILYAIAPILRKKGLVVTKGKTR